MYLLHQAFCICIIVSRFIRLLDCLRISTLHQIHVQSVDILCSWLFEQSKKIPTKDAIISWRRDVKLRKQLLPEDSNSKSIFNSVQKKADKKGLKGGALTILEVEEVTSIYSQNSNIDAKKFLESKLFEVNVVVVFSILIGTENNIHQLCVFRMIKFIIFYGQL